MLRLVIACSVVGLVAARADVSISAPDIYPDSNEPFVGDVMIRLVNNAAQAYVTYTMDGTDPTNTSTPYTTPISLFKPGSYKIQAAAFPETGGRGSSAIASRTYVVVAADQDAPEFTPGPGKYRGGVQLRPTKPVASSVVMRYAVNPIDPETAEWLDLHDFVGLSNPGDYQIYVVAVDTKRNATSNQGATRGGGQKVTPMAKYRYVVKAPLVYDVSTECGACGGLVRVGETFTVWIQNVMDDSRLFLSTSKYGCERKTHRVDDTAEVSLTPWRPYSHFQTADDDTYIFVCFSEGGGPFQAVAPRVPITDSKAFKLNPPIRHVVRTTNPPGQRPNGDDDAVAAFDNSRSSMVTFMNVLLWITVLAVVIFVARAFRHADAESRKPLVLF